MDTEERLKESVTLDEEKVEIIPIEIKILSFDFEGGATIFLNQPIK
jgi:hypothetical protein